MSNSNFANPDDKLIEAIQESQKALQASLVDLGRDFSLFSGKVIAQLEYLNEKFNRQNGRVDRNERAVNGIKAGMASMGAIVDDDGEVRHIDRRRREQPEPEKSKDPPYVVILLNGIPPRVWWSATAIIVLVVLILGLQGALPTLAENIAKHQYQLEHSKEAKQK